MSISKIIKLVAIFITITNNLLAQNIHGTVTDGAPPKPLSHVQILNKRTLAQTFSDAQGRFQIPGNVHDTLQFSSVGYYTVYKTVPDTRDWKIHLHPLTYHLNQVDVLDKKPIPQIYKSEVGFDEKPKLLEALTHPISFLYYRFSKREKAKLNARNLLENEQKMARVMTIYNKELLQKYTGWTGKKLDDCMMYCNAHIELSEGDDEFSIRYKVLELIALYRKDVKSVKERDTTLSTDPL